MAKFYHFYQNNSGGSFHHDHAAGIGANVWIEANSASHANARAERIGLYFDGCRDGHDCPCCGDRWQECSEHDAMEAPQLYGEPLTHENGYQWGTPSYVHYLGADGVVAFGTEAR